VASNLLDRQFAVAAPNRVWVVDFTYLATDDGWLYLAGLKDLFDSEHVGCALGERMTPGFGDEGAVPGNDCTASGEGLA
jgi:putative transposase